MTRAPRSASCRVANGAATACSIDTTVIPCSGRLIARLKPSQYELKPSRYRTIACGAKALAERSIRPRQAEHVLGDVREDQVRGDRRDLIQACLPELPLDVVVLRETEPAVRLNRDVGRLP